MLWPAYFILAYLLIGLQLGLTAHLSWGGAWPNLVLLGAIFLAINAPRDVALLGALGLGILHDLTTAQPMGLSTFSYGLVALLMVNTQNVVYRGHPLTHFSLALVGGAVCGLILYLHGLIRHGGGSLGVQLNSAIYTAVAGVIVIGILNRMRKMFAFQPPRRKVRM